MLLSLDTSSLVLSVALVERDGAVIEHLVEGPPKRQSELLPAVVKELLGRHGLTLQHLEGFVCGLGPGSFTGLRIGLATLKGFAYAVEKPLVGVSSLAALALEGPEGDSLTCAVVKRGELYLGYYRKRGGAVTLVEPERSVTVAQLAALAQALPGAKVFGPAVAEYRAPLEALGVAPAAILDAPSFPSAVELARLAALPARYRKEDVFALEPHYLRGSGAEENPKFPPLPGPEPKARYKDD